MTAAEQQYLGALLAVLKDGIRNRLNIEGVLKTDSERDTYTAVPATLQTIEDHLCQFDAI